MANRPIKFRAWDIQGKKWANRWELHGMYGEGGVITIDGKDHDANQLVTLSQYTGLKDKNGKEIYEGDVVDGKFMRDGHWHQGPHGVVEWDNEYAAFEINANSLNGFVLEVIGNIYENPDLIKP